MPKQQEPKSWQNRLAQDPDQARLLRNLTARLKKNRDDLAVDPALVAELETYLKQVPLLPRHVSALKASEVKKAQGILAELDAQQTRVAAVQFSVAKTLQVLTRLDLTVRNILLNVGLVNERSTKPAVANMVALVCPALAQHQAAWEGMERLSALVAGRLNDAKDSLRLQIKLDDNARWAAKGGPA